MATLRLGSTGVEVEKLQKALGLTVDGEFGPVTERAVKAFQKANGLPDDGIVGGGTWKALEVNPTAVKLEGGITLAKLKRVFPEAKPGILEAILKYTAEYGLPSKDLRMFIAQAGHETGGFVRFVENLNYSAQGLANTWETRYAKKGADGKYLKHRPDPAKGLVYVPNDLAIKIQKKPREIANRTYGDRNGNRGIDTNDGWNFRGRGCFQLTFLGNYLAFQKAYPKFKVVDNPDLVATDVECIVVSAIWFWTNNRLGRHGDNVARVTAGINGGDKGLAHRTELFKALA